MAACMAALPFISAPDSVGTRKGSQRVRCGAMCWKTAVSR